MYFLHCDSALQVNDYGKFGTTIFSGLFYLFYIYAVNFLFHKRRKKKTFNAIEVLYFSQYTDFNIEMTKSVGLYTMHTRVCLCNVQRMNSKHDDHFKKRRKKNPNR